MGEEKGCAGLSGAGIGSERRGEARGKGRSHRRIGRWLLPFLLLGPGAGVGWAQEGGEGEAATRRDGELSLDLRFFEAGEGHVALGWRQNWSPVSGSQVQFLQFKSQGAPFAGDEWETTVSLGEVAGHYRVCRDRKQDLWIGAGVEFHTTQGRNLTTGEEGESTRPIPTVGLRLERPVPQEQLERDLERIERAQYWYGLRGAFFESGMDATTGERLPYFGSVWGLEIGGQAWYRNGWDVSATLFPIFSGENTVDQATGHVARDWIWSAGVGYAPREGSRWRVEFLLTNGAGPTGATSLVASVDRTVAPSLRVRYGF